MFSTFEAAFTFFTALCMALSSRVVHSMTLDQISRVETSAEFHETKPDELLKTILWLENLSKNSPKDESLLAQLSRLKFYYAINDTDKSSRIKKYQDTIDAANKALALNADDPVANFWKAAAIGNQGLASESHGPSKGHTR